MKESGATIDFNISAPNVAFYDDSCISWRNMYSMIKVPSDVEGRFDYKPPCATYVTQCCDKTL